MPQRKRQRQNPTTAASAVKSQDRSTARGQSTSEQVAHGDREMPPSHSTDSSFKSSLQHDSVRKTQSWYGSWPRPPKASASTSLARETIIGDTFRSPSTTAVNTPEASRFDSKSSKAASVRSAAGSLAAQSQSIRPAVEETPSKSTTTLVVNEPNITTETSTTTVHKEQETSAASQTSPNLEDTLEPPPATPDQIKQQPPGWLGWFSRTPFTETSVNASIDQTDPSASATEAEAEAEAGPVVAVEQTQAAPEPLTEAVPTPTTASLADPTQRPVSWFSLWPATPTTPSNMKNDSEKDEKAEEAPKTGASEDVVMEDAPPTEAAEPTTATEMPKAGSTWAFWSRDTAGAKGKTKQAQDGEIAVIGQGSESHPTPMPEGNISSSQQATEEINNKGKDQKSTWRKNKRSRPASLDEIPASSTPSGASTPRRDADLKTPTTQTVVSESDAATTTTASPNLLLPSFASTYRMKENPSILQQISSLLLRTSQPPVNHVFRSQEVPRIRKAIAIGVHGLFPATYLRPMIGQPTGTSLRFAGLCADAIHRWTESHGYTDCKVEKVALEGDGRINDRVENLWRLLLNWIEHIRGADLIIMACHSQGVPVSIMLLEKLIDLGIITNAKIGVCAMAGVALGPFPDYKSSLLMGSAAELWDFGNPQSQNSQKFETALKRVLDYGARITFVGSIDDQVVPMESAVYSPASHPYIYRAVFIDGRIHAPDFIAHLVGFALKLRNLGVSDHGLIRELSLALAGSLYSGEGHSRLYFDQAVYDLAISHALETTSVSKPTPCEIRHHTPATTTTAGVALPLASANPYFLPWTMRGMLEEDFVKTELSSETEELLRQFDDWKPTNKALKDVKYRLEVVRSKL